ncbi:MAG: hypothetical protein WAV23_03015 [Minisyncoccia bacterium]
MMNFEEYKKIATESKDADLFKQYEEYRKQWFQEEQKTLETGLADKEKRATFRFEFMKYFFGSIIIGGFTAYTTFIFKDYELKLQTRKQDSETIAPYVKQFIDLMEQDSYKYTRVHAMCEFLSYTIIEDSLKTGFTTLRNLYQNKIDKAKEGVVLNSDSLKSIVNHIDSLTSEIHSQGITKSKLDTVKIKNQIIVLQTQAEAYNAKKNEAITFAKEKLENISDLDIPVSSNPSSYNVIYEENRYTGPGWFSEIIENFSIHMNEVSLSENKVKYDLKWDKETLSTKIQKIGEESVFTVLNNNYKITILLIAISKRKVFYTIKIEKRIKQNN